MSVTVVLDPIKVKVEPKQQVSVMVAPATTRVRVDLIHQSVTVAPEVVRVQVSPIGTQGAPGVPGAPGGSAIYEVLAGEVLGGDRVVKIGPDGLAYYADHSNSDDGSAPLYWTLGSASAGSPVSVQSSGPISTPGFGWVPGQKIWLGDAGVPSDLFSVSEPFRRLIGVAETPDRIHFNPHTAIYN